MSNSLASALSQKSLDVVWRYEKERLRGSCFGVDRQTGRDFEASRSFQFARLRERTRGAFKPQGLLAISKPKQSGGGSRIICVPTISDRVLQFAILNEIRDSLAKKRLLNSISYGLVRGADRRVQDARERAIALRSSRGWVYKADIEKFFDNIPRDAVRRATTTIVAQRSLHKVILPFIDTEIEDGFDPDWREIIAKAGIVTGRGVRQGMPLSPYFAGMILRDLDCALEKRSTPAIRYVDDIVAFFSSRRECEAFHSFLEAELQKLGLSIGTPGAPGSKTDIFAPDKPVPFLGMEICRASQGNYKLRISEATIQKIGAKLAGAGDIDVLLKKKVTLPRLETYLGAMAAGYLQAYDGAENHGALQTEVRVMKRAALENVLEQTLGEQVSKLGRKERRFLGIG